MSVQGGLSIERMCRLGDVSRAGFYRSYEIKMPSEDELQLKGLVQEIVLEAPAEVWISPGHSGTSSARNNSEPSSVSRASCEKTIC